MAGKINTLSLVSAAMAIAVWMGGSRNGSAQTPVPTPAIAPQFLLEQRAMTVIGQGQATAPADTARIQFRFASRAPLNTPQAVAPVETAEGEVVSPVELALQPVVDALVAIKVPPENIQVQTDDPENPKVLVKLDKPTRERVKEVVRAASSVFQGSDNFFIQGIGVEYAVNNCQPLERAARRAALRDALSQANVIALDLGVKVGEILFVTMFPSFGSPASAGCGSKVGVPASPLFAFSESMPPYDPSANPEVQLRIQVSITYAIKSIQ